MKIKIKYLNPNLHKIEKISVGDWIDLRASEEVVIGKDAFKLIPLGVAMEIPDGYEAHIVPRSSTFKNYGIIQTNGMGIIDSSYCGDNDQWFMPVIGTRYIRIHPNERICQFRITQKMPEVNLVEVESLGNPDRGGHGSTGTI